MSSQHSSHAKSVKTLKSPKKLQEYSELNVDDVFHNSEYFKHAAGNFSSLSFCSGDNGEHQWTIDSSCDIPFRQKPLRAALHKSDVIKSDTAVATEKTEKWNSRGKKRNCYVKENSQEKAEMFLEGILSEKETERDLISLITEQMFLAERELQITRKHLIDTISKLNERDLQIIQLHEKIKFLEETSKFKSLKTNTPNKEAFECLNKSSEDYQKLVKASEKLKKQVKDMEDFLNDYGLVWVGDKETIEKPDFDKIINNFQRLNTVASQTKIIQTTLGAKFEVPRGIPITLYTNGFLLRDEFREYGKMSSSFFLQDIEDGYFPSELQTEYPEGVPFEVFDKRNEVFNENYKLKAFQGPGIRLGSTLEGKSSSIVYLQPVEQKGLCSTSMLNYDHWDKSPPKKIQGKRSKNYISEGISNQKINAELNQEEISRSVQAGLLRIKIRFGRGQSESLVLEMPKNKKMFTFQKLLHRKFCEKFHEECIVNYETTKEPPDFELHMYGQNPFRLSDRLNQYPKDCGIVDHCVINVVEI